jgi:hypothetical protein
MASRSGQSSSQTWAPARQALKGICVCSGGGKPKKRSKMMKRHCSGLARFHNGKYAKQNFKLAKLRKPSLTMVHLQISLRDAAHVQNHTCTLPRP